MRVRLDDPLIEVIGILGPKLMAEASDGVVWSAGIDLETTTRWAEFLVELDLGAEALVLAEEAARYLMWIGVLELVPAPGMATIRMTKLGFEQGPEAAGRDFAVRRIRELNAMRYDECLRSPEWRSRRAEHIRVAGERCQLCNSDEAPLHVHHRTYENRGHERFYDLVVLCPPCHEAFHKSGRAVR